MNQNNILARLGAGEFDMKYTTQEYRDVTDTYRYEYEITNGRIYKRRLINGACSEMTEYDSDSDKIAFIFDHPYFFPYDDDFK